MPRGVGRDDESLAEAFFDAWTAVLQTVAKDLGPRCPGCARERKCKRRLDQMMKVRLLGMDIAVPKAEARR